MKNPFPVAAPAIGHNAYTNLYLFGIVMLFIGYYRVSSSRQGQSGLGLDAQREAVRQYISREPRGELANDYVEIESGTRNARPVLAEAMAECRRRKAILLIARLDRLARNVSFVSSLLDSKVDFVACDVPGASRMMLQILSVFAEHEARMISERTKAALAAAKARGVLLGSFGQELACRQKIEALSFAREMAGPIAAARATGAVTLEAIAGKLNLAGYRTREGGIWRPMTVSRAIGRLENPDYIASTAMAG